MVPNALLSEEKKKLSVTVTTIEEVGYGMVENSLGERCEVCGMSSLTFELKLRKD